MESIMMNFEMLDSSTTGTVMKVVGVGGAGGNAVAHMIRSGVNGVDFICANPDSQALVASEAPVQIRLGCTGLGAGAHTERGRAQELSGRGRRGERVGGGRYI